MLRKAKLDIHSLQVHHLVGDLRLYMHDRENEDTFTWERSEG